MKTLLTNLSPAEMAEALQVKPFQARQLFRWLHQKQIFDIEKMTDLSKELRARLTETCEPAQLSLAHTSESPRSTTKKLLFRLQDGETVESVLIRERERVTVCVSTQVGCAVKCSFCATGLSGYKRNLSAGEIAEQALHLLSGENIEGRHPNIVYMGMGEPFRNYDAVISSVRLLMDKEGMGVGARRITISTAGEAEGIRRFAGEPWQVRLSISLHAANDDLRDELVPLNKRYPLKTLREAVGYYAEVTGRHVTFEWVLLDGVNDGMKDVGEIAGFVEGLDATVNLIPFNPVQGTPYAPPPRGKSESFRNALVARGIKTTLRKEKGQDINAACGQLRRQALSLGA
ncbi:MAG: 23S rRNA (adenine(2503)-C(2))-methyltransferase RlmN [Candidatus Hydrogenedentes bacterium]|nr:23S rRNA (adenine(2503)-C(2))-methyltransferase RlmN [Candidatus Hydrogenedentota bacterium]